MGIQEKKMNNDWRMGIQEKKMNNDWRMGIQEKKMKNDWRYYGNPMNWPGPKGDFISREALKEEMQKADIKANDYETLAKMYENCVDNAPTVEINTNDIEYKAYCKGLDDGKQIARPQGEWIIRSNGTTNHYACSKCGNAGDIQDKFCRECGVKMKGGAKND